ncbi:MAG: hypothetical protein OXG44_20855, partial [Gammaproteobacteria bacterium]|nr:hypothetical protein [Gammaproteobacteria bacterium]
GPPNKPCERFGLPNWRIASIDGPGPTAGLHPLPTGSKASPNRIFRRLVRTSAHPDRLAHRLSLRQLADYYPLD